MSKLLLNKFSPRKLVIWYKPKNNSYYYKLVSGYYSSYEVGYINKYDHVIVLIIDLVFYDHSISLKKRLIHKLISFLERIERS